MTSQISPPGPRGQPLVGNMVAYTEDPLGFLTHCARTYGDVVKLGEHNYLLAHPDHVYRVLLNADQVFVKVGAAARGRRGPGFGLAMMNSEGEDWQHKRRWVQAAFSRERAHAWAPQMVEATEQLCSTWGEGETRDLLPDMLGLGLTIICQVLFSAAAVDQARIQSAAAAIIEVTRTPVRLPPWLPTPANRRFQNALRQFDAVIAAQIEQHRAGNGNDVLSQLLEQPLQGTSEPKQLRDELATLILSGHETSADGLVWIFTLLAQHPEVAARLAVELETVLGERPVTATDVPNLRYTAAVIKEAFRLYPPAWLTSRESVRETEIGGYTVPEGTVLALSAWVLHHDPRWYEQPELFRPERWLDGSLDTLPRGAYIPFGAGSRVCVGAGLAQLEAALIVATIARQVRMEIAPGQQVTPFPALALRPDGARMVIRRNRH